jgi:PAS domain S-box-containing protein
VRPSGTEGDEDQRLAVRQALGALSGLIPIGVVAVDPDGLSWYHNQRWEDVSGTTGLSLQGSPWYLAVHPDDIESVAECWRNQVELRGRLGRFRAVAADGVVRECRGEVVPMVGTDGEVGGYLVVVTDSDADEGSPVLSGAHLLDAVLDRARDIITILNPDGSWRWSSGGALRLLGHQAEFDPATGILPFFHPDDRAQAREFMEQAMADQLGPDERIELRMQVADGSWRYMEGAVDVLLDDPAVRGLVIHARDVTERRQAQADLEASNRRLASLISNVRTAVVLEDEERRIVLANQAFVDLFHLPVAPGELEGRTLESVGLSADKLIVDPPNASERAARMMAERNRLEAIRVTLFDGRTLEYDFVPMFVQDTFRGHLSAYRDVTHQARAEEEQKRLLASEREENRRLAEMDAYRSEFLAAVSHDLRTPLTSIVGYTQLLRNMLDPESAPEEVECLDAIVRNVDRLLRLTGDLVVLDSMESRTFPLNVTPVDVPATIRHAEQTIIPVATTHAIEVVVDAADGPLLQGDGDRLEQLFENLLSNAVKFTPPEGRVTVRAMPSAAGWEIEISDTGMGIPEDEQTLLFSRFFRASNARRRGLPGSGLGLSVARAIVDLHGGTIAVRSVVGSGTTVTVCLREAVPAEDCDKDLR